MSVADSISSALQRFGRTMTLRRVTAGPAGTKIYLDVSVYGTIKGYRPQEMVGTYEQGDSVLTISNTEIAAAQWPGPPRSNDEFVVDGKVRRVKSVETKHLGTAVLVHVCQVAG